MCYEKDSFTGHKRIQTSLYWCRLNTPALESSSTEECDCVMKLQGDVLLLKFNPNYRTENYCLNSSSTIRNSLSDIT